MDLSIIIVNYNSKDYLRKCIDSIRVNTHDLAYEIIVVDSASFDGCGEMLKRFYPEVHFIQSHHNLGFARSNNLGFNSAKGSVLLFLNPDTELNGPAIAMLYAGFLTLADVGVAGCRLLNSDGTLQTSCVQPLPTLFNQLLDFQVFQRWFPELDLWLSAARFEREGDPVAVDAVSGACMMVRRDVFDNVGGFSADYFMYAEDMDLCCKTSWAGFKNYYVPQAVITHHGGGSSKDTRSDFSDVMMRESVRRFLEKFRGNHYGDCYRLALAGAAAFRLLFLAAAWPAWLAGGRGRRWTVAVSKWVAIMRWALGMGTRVQTAAGSK